VTLGLGRGGPAGLAPKLGLADGDLAWDVYLLFAPGIRWEKAPPEPTSWMHRLGHGPPQLRLDAKKLAAEIESWAARTTP
jgi:hypothetical protein